MNDDKIINEIQLARDEFFDGAIIEARDRLLNVINIIDDFIDNEDIE